MAIVRMTAEEVMRPLTPEQIARLEALKDYEPVPDEENPEITPEEFKHFRRRADRLAEQYANRPRSAD